MFRNKKHMYGEELLAPCPTLKLVDHHLLAVHDCLFNIFTATLHIGGHSSIHNLSTCHAAVTGTHLSWYLSQYLSNFNAWPKNIFSEWYLFTVCCFRFLFLCIFTSCFNVCHCGFCSILWKKEVLFLLFLFNFCLLYMYICVWFILTLNGLGSGFVILISYFWYSSIRVSRNEL